MESIYRKKKKITHFKDEEKLVFEFYLIRFKIFP